MQTQSGCRLPRLFALFVVLSSIIGCLGCSTTDLQPGECDINNDCQSGAVCVGGVCLQLCAEDSGCRADQVCSEGSCTDVPNAECARSDECTSPNRCELDTGAFCHAGRCHYQKKACATPPDHQCVEGDTIYRAYPSTGACDPDNGNCLYAPLDIPCANCSIACLARCVGVVCEETQGGCQLDGYCVPADSVSCSYTSAGDGSICTRPEDIWPEQTGLCLEGLCGECADVTDCQTSPDARCHEASCVDGACIYNAQVGVQCEGAECAEGTVSNARICDTAGGCPENGTTSCLGFACNPAGDGCLVTCSDNADCVAPFECDGSDCVLLSCGDDTCSANETCVTCPADCGACPIDGACSAGVTNGCSAGTLNDLADTSTTIRWRCDGQDGGSNSPVCVRCAGGPGIYACGAFAQSAPGQTVTSGCIPGYSGSCSFACQNDGTYDGTGACVPDPVNGVCNQSVTNGCAAGTLNNLADIATTLRWRCDGENGGSNSAVCVRCAGGAGYLACGPYPERAPGQTATFPCAAGFTGTCTWTCQSDGAYVGTANCN